MTSVLVNTYGADERSCHLLLVKPIAVISVLGRLMQGAASTSLEVVVYEVCETLTELFLADSLLRGLTPLQGNLAFLAALAARRGNCVVQSKTSIQIETYHYCSSAMIITGICEATSIFVALAIWLLNPANPGRLGADGRMSVSGLCANFVVMLVGEWLLTDSLIAYISHHFKRYQLNVTATWQKVRSGESEERSEEQSDEALRLLRQLAALALRPL